jgi:hypothetical protein
MAASAFSESRSRLHLVWACLFLLSFAACPRDEPTDDDDVSDDDDGDDDDGDDDDGDDDDGDDDDAAPDCRRIATFEDGAAPSSELHVAPDGDDGNDGSAEAPFATIDRAVTDAVPGTAIRVHEGTYAGFGGVGTARGTAEAPIWIGGAPGEGRPHIEGGSTGIQLVAGAYVILHDLEVSGQSDNGVNFDDGGAVGDPDAAHHFVFRNLWIHDVGSGNNNCLKLSGLDDFFVLNNEFADCGGAGSGSGVDMVGCHDGVIAYNTFTDHSANGIQAKGGTADVTIRANHFRSAGDRSINLGGSTGLRFFRPPPSEFESNAEARNLLVYANIFEGAEASLAYVGCTGCVVVNNTLVDPTRWVLRILQETTSGEFEFEPVQNGRFENNIVRYELGVISRHLNIGPNTSPETFEFTHNLWFASDNPGSSTPDLPVGETDSIYGEDPGFVDGFRIGTTSPAAGAGRPLPELAGDFAGNCWSNPPAIGAFEAE